MTIANLPTDLLRAFVTVANLNSFTKAGEALGRTQPAVSLQIRRLEECVGMKLITTRGRSLELTPAGETLLGYARKILSLNDEALANFKAQRSSGVIRVGLPTDYAAAYLQGVLREFSERRPDVELSISCETSESILKDLEQDLFDIVVAMGGPEDSPLLAKSWFERPVWVTGRDSDPPGSEPVRLVAHPEGCQYRRRMTSALDASGRTWRVVFSSPGVSGLQSAVEQSHGISALARHSVTKDMRILTQANGLPSLPDLHVGLYCKQQRQSPAGLALVNHLIANLVDAGGLETDRPASALA